MQAPWSLAPLPATLVAAILAVARGALRVASKAALVPLEALLGVPVSPKVEVPNPEEPTITFSFDFFSVAATIFLSQVLSDMGVTPEAPSTVALAVAVVAVDVGVTDDVEAPEVSAVVEG